MIFSTAEVEQKRMVGSTQGAPDQLESRSNQILRMALGYPVVQNLYEQVSNTIREK